MSLWTRIFPYSASGAGVPGICAPVSTPSDAGRALNAARIQADRARRVATTDALRADVAAGRIAHLGWKQ